MKTKLTILGAFIVGICLTVAFFAVRQTLRMEQALTTQANAITQVNAKVDSVIQFINKQIEASQSTTTTQ